MCNSHRHFIHKGNVHEDSDDGNEKSKHDHSSCKDEQVQIFTSDTLTNNVVDSSNATASNETIKVKHVKVNPTSIAVGMAAARLPHRKLSLAQRQKLRNCIQRLESEAYEYAQSKLVNNWVGANDSAVANAQM